MSPVLPAPAWPPSIGLIRSLSGLLAVTHHRIAAGFASRPGGRRSTAALAWLAQELTESAGPGERTTVIAQSMRNRFPGLITRVIRDTVLAQVDIQAGPHRFVSLLSREAADELGLEPGTLMIAAIKATSVSVEIAAGTPARS